MFQSLSEKLDQAFKKFRSKGTLTEADVKAGMREIKLALLEADVNFKVVKDFIKIVSERAVGAEVMESLLPGQQVSRSSTRSLPVSWAAPRPSWRSPPSLPQSS